MRRSAKFTIAVHLFLNTFYVHIMFSIHVCSVPFRGSHSAHHLSDQENLRSTEE